MKKKAELQGDENVWNPQLWIESSGDFTRGRVSGAPSVDSSTVMQRSFQSNLIADHVNQESSGVILTSEIKSIIEKEVQLAITKLYNSSTPSNPQRTNQFTQLPGQISQPSDQTFFQPPSQIAQPSTQPFPQPPIQVLQPPTQSFLQPSNSISQPPITISQPPNQTCQPCDQTFIQASNHISQLSGQFSQPLYQFAHPAMPYQLTLEQFQSMHVPLQPTFGNFPQQVSSFIQLLTPVAQDQLKASNHHGNNPSQNEDDE